MMETIGRRRKRERNYVTIENSMFDDERLTWKAKGILGYLLTKPDGWKVRIKDLMNHGSDGEKSIRSGLQELQKFGYLAYYRTKEKGKFTGIEWVYDDVPFQPESIENVVTEPFEPQPQKGNVEETAPQPQNAVVEKRPVEKASVENHPCINKDLPVTKKDFNNYNYDYQSIILPNVLHVIEKVFGENISDDRLIDICNSYYYFYEKLTVLELQHILRAMRDTNNKISNVQAYLYKSFANALRQAESAQIKEDEAKPTENTPEWFKEQKEEEERLRIREAMKIKKELTPEEIERRKKEIEEIIEGFSKN